MERRALRGCRSGPSPEPFRAQSRFDSKCGGFDNRTACVSSCGRQDQGRDRGDAKRRHDRGQTGIRAPTFQPLSDSSGRLTARHFTVIWRTSAGAYPAHSGRRNHAQVHPLGCPDDRHAGGDCSHSPGRQHRSGSLANSVRPAWLYRYSPEGGRDITPTLAIAKPSHAGASPASRSFAA